jgi:hypothetical protein
MDHWIKENAPGDIIYYSAEFEQDLVEQIEEYGLTDELKELEKKSVIK